MKKLLRIIRAKLNRTFVADCPKCHKHFYGAQGYEQHVASQYKDKVINYRYVCNNCAKDCVKEYKECVK